MPRFRYEAIDAAGRAQSGAIDAEDETQAFSRLQAQSLTVISLDAGDRAVRKVPWYRRDITLSRRGFSANEEADLAERLAVLFRARLPIGETLRVIADSARRPATARLFRRIQALVADGLPLARAFEVAGGNASPVFQTLLELSVDAADPSTLMQNYARLLRRQSGTRSRILGAMVYPIILIAGAVGVLMLVSLFLAPSLTPMFAALDQPVPTSLAVFNAIGLRLAAYGWMLGALSLAVAGLVIVLWDWPDFSRGRYVLTRRLPGIGAILRTGDLARMVRAVDLLLGIGLDMPAAFRRAAGTVGDRGAGRTFMVAADALERGSTAASVFEKDTTLPRLFRELFRTAEETNLVRDVLPLLGDNLENVLERQTENAVGLFAPVVTVVLGGAIGLLAYTVMSAILSVNDVAF